MKTLLLLLSSFTNCSIIIIFLHLVEEAAAGRAFLANISDETIKGIKVRLQKIEGLPTKELRKLVDIGKKDLGEGIVIIFAHREDKIGLAVGVTAALIKNYNAVDFAKKGSEIIGGKGGGGRPDFAQAGGTQTNKIDEAIKKLKSLI